MTGAAEALKARLRRDLKSAMQARQPQEARLLRVILAAIDNAEAVAVEESPQTIAPRFADGAQEVPRRILSQVELDRLLEAEAAARLAAAADYDRLSRPDEAARLKAEAETVGRYRSAG
jgi:uncharacterized protein YqeY